MTTGSRGPSTGEARDAAAITQIMRACHERRLEREGIPMILGLADERGEIPANTDGAVVRNGVDLSRMLSTYHSGLAGFARPDDEGALITAMQVVAYAHFAPDAFEAASS